MDPRRKIEGARARTGWNDQSVIAVLIEYIRRQDSPEAFEDYIDMKVEFEEGQSGFDFT